MGWIGWTSDQTLDTPIPMIDIARKGRVDLLRQIFGSPEQPTAPTQPALTPAMFKAMFAK